MFPGKWLSLLVSCGFTQFPFSRQREQLKRLQRWVESGPSSCPAASPVATATISVSSLRPCSKLKLWVFGDKIQNPGMRREGETGAGRWVSQVTNFLLQVPGPRLKFVQGTGTDGPVFWSSSQSIRGPLLSPLLGLLFTLSGQDLQRFQASIFFTCETGADGPAAMESGCDVSSATRRLSIR